jgi:hypothetical protein
VYQGQEYWSTGGIILAMLRHPRLSGLLLKKAVFGGQSPARQG